MPNNVAELVYGRKQDRSSLSHCVQQSDSLFRWEEFS